MVIWNANQLLVFTKFVLYLFLYHGMAGYTNVFPTGPNNPPVSRAFKTNKAPIRDPASFLAVITYVGELSHMLLRLDRLALSAGRCDIAKRARILWISTSNAQGRILNSYERTILFP